MSNRDWEKELAMIDRQLASLPDEKLVPKAGPTPAGPAAAPAGAPRLAPGTAAPPIVGGLPATIAPPRSWRSRVAVAGKLLLAAGLAALATPGLWPYGWRCGSELIIYLAVAAAAVLAGLWAARASWRHRAGGAHALALLVTLWGLGLVAWQVLPRTGVFVPTERVAVPAVWACQ